MTAHQHPHALRFRLLVDLCYALGEQGCASMLFNPLRGETALYVPYPDRPRQRLGVGAIEDRGRWMFTYGREWSLADNADETAARIVAAVRTR
ncbi:hypothetical protein [Actinomadura sp. 6N118]|uniref:hypothetical protein n=1 Tax=Actinomadura sp. 6N118 TaxID=3375151 RepID=UPI00378F8F9A